MTLGSVLNHVWLEKVNNGKYFEYLQPCVEYKFNTDVSGKDIVF